MGKSKGRGFEYNSEWVNRHHLFEKKDGGSNHERNILVMEIVRHRALHVLFNQTPDTTPLGKVDTVLGLHSQVLAEECRQDIKEVLNFWRKEGREAYDPRVLRGRTVLDR